MAKQRELGIAVIGVGWIGQVHCRIYRQIQDLYPDLPVVPRLKMVVDVSEPAARGAAERFAVEKVALDWQEALDDPEIDVIDICVGNRFHEPVAVAAAAAGKHIFCEKPLANSVAEAQRMVDAVESAGVVNMVGFNYRHLPASLAAKEIVEAGDLGEIFHFRGLFAIDDKASPESPWAWRFSAEEAGAGALGTLGSHDLDMARFLAGDFHSLTALIKTLIKERPVRGTETMRPVDVDDMTGMLVRFASGATGVIETTWLAWGDKHHHSWEVNGSKGSLRYNSERMNELEWYDASGPRNRQGFRTLLMGPAFPEAGAFIHLPGMGMGYSDGMVIELKDFLLAIAEGRPASASFADGLAVSRITDAALRSGREGVWVEV
jgi:predicted dehydrogenase